MQTEDKPACAHVGMQTERLSSYDRQTYTHVTDTDEHTQTKKTDRQTDTSRDRQTDKQTDIQTGTLTNKHTDKDIDRHADR